MTTLAATILVFGLLVLVHELGHFITAKWLKMRVDEFAIGFGPKIISHKRGETLYSLRAIPLGGFNKIAGMDPDGPQDEHTFCAKPVWARMLVILAGSAMNLLLPIILFCGIFWGNGIDYPSEKAVIGTLMKDKPAIEAGFMVGDHIQSVNGVAIENWKEFVLTVQKNADNKLVMEVLRGGESITLAVTPIEDPKSKRGIIGIMPEMVIYKPGVYEGLEMAVGYTIRVSKAILTGIFQMITGQIDADIAGPIGVAQMTGQVAKEGLVPLAHFAAVLSINLGLINLLPVPVLDGGHMVTLAIEGIRRKPLSGRSLQIVQSIGLALMLMLFLLATFKDVSRLKLF